MYHKELDLQRMGYRKLEGDVWGKPIGYMLFTFSVHTNSIHANFLDKKGNTSLWDSDIFKEEQETSFLDFIKVFESYTRTDVAVGHCSEFHFLTQEEYYNSRLTLVA
ncbi:MAG TPA: hypothetical protein VGM30_10430 [Puia sp.]|jgi:hypothetical protein